MNTTVIKIFTDGSCNPTFHIGAWAAIMLFGNRKLQLTGESPDTTHQRMELLAVIKSIEFVDEEYNNTSFEIYTDSQYVVGITNRKERLMKNQFITKKGNQLHNSDLIRILIHQIETHTIEFIKIKAHQKSETDVGNKMEINPINYNIEVDKLVRAILRDAVKRTHPDL